MIRETRAALEAVLGGVQLAGVTVPVVSSDSLEPPAINIVEHDPMIADDPLTFGSYRVALDLVLTVRAGDTAVMVDQLDELVDQVVAALDPSDFDFTVNGYRVLNYDGQPILSATVNTSTDTQ